ncbi:MAG TPA: nicotinate (nicotinamide) nucleotide adenylyltransferase [Candidatus Cloacimonetes bacterium]|nr:nicotinate (nicotinamide) nucleotide adenylyltransferase [Candidatus Cloacimonadota bacterium]
MKIGLFGGTFNPVHNGHIAVANAVFGQLKLDKIWFLPAGKHPFKPNTEIFSYQQRFDLITAAIDEYPEFEVHDFDFHESKLSYTDDLIKQLRKKFPEYEFYFIIGADNVHELPLWHNYRWLIDNVRIVVVNRPEIDKSKWRNLDFLNKLLFVEMKPVDISSTEIRERIRKQESIKEMVPKIIEKDIMNIE